MKIKLFVFFALLASAALFVGGCASSGSRDPIMVSSAQVAGANEIIALDAAEQVLLSRGFDPLNIEKEKGYMRFVRKVDANTMREVNVRVVQNQSGGSELDVDVVVMRTEPERKTGLSFGGGFGIGGGGAVGLGLSPGGAKKQDKAKADEIRDEISEAVKAALEEK